MLRTLKIAGKLVKWCMQLVWEVELYWSLLKKNTKPTYPSVRDCSAQSSLQPAGFPGRGRCHMEVLVCVSPVTQTCRAFSAPWMWVPEASADLSAGLWRLQAPVWLYDPKLGRKERFFFLLPPKCLKLSAAWWLEEEIHSVIYMFRCCGHKRLFWSSSVGGFFYVMDFKGLFPTLVWAISSNIQSLKSPTSAESTTYQISSFNV